MLKVKLSSKRQTTFPKRVCDALGLKPGDELLLDQRIEPDGEVLVLRAARPRARSWLGCLQAYAQYKPHDMAAIRASIVEGRSREDA